MKTKINTVMILLIGKKVNISQVYLINHMCNYIINAIVYQWSGFSMFEISKYGRLHQGLHY